MNLILSTDDEWCFKILGIFLNGGGHNVISFLLSVNKVCRGLSIELGPALVLRLAQHGVCEVVEVEVAVDFRRCDDKVALGNSSERNSVFLLEDTVDQYLTIFKLLNKDSTSASMSTRQDYNDSARLKVLAQWLPVCL